MEYVGSLYTVNKNNDQQQQQTGINNNIALTYIQHHSITSCAGIWNMRGTQRWYSNMHPDLWAFQADEGVTGVFRIWAIK